MINNISKPLTFTGAMKAKDVDNDEVRQEFVTLKNLLKGDDDVRYNCTHLDDMLKGKKGDKVNAVLIDKGIQGSGNLFGVELDKDLFIYNNAKNNSADEFLTEINEIHQGKLKTINKLEKPVSTIEELHGNLKKRNEVFNKLPEDLQKVVNKYMQIAEEVTADHVKGKIKQIKKYAKSIL